MKMILIASLLAWAFVGTTEAKKKPAPVLAQTEEVRSLATVPVDAADLQELLELKGMYIYKYDLSGIRDTSMQVTVRVDEHFGRDSVRTIRRLMMGDLFYRWNSTYSESLKVMIVPQTDSTSMLYCDLEGRMKAGVVLNLRKVPPKFTLYNTYRPVPFKMEELKMGEQVPVMLFGSFWHDAKLSERLGGQPAYRFCMEKVMEADMRNEAFDLMPHYWVVYVGLQKKGK